MRQIQQILADNYKQVDKFDRIGQTNTIDSINHAAAKKLQVGDPVEVDGKRGTIVAERDFFAAAQYRH